MELDLTHPTLSDLRARAKRRLPHFAWEYLDSGTGDDAAIRRSRAALDAVVLAPAVLKGRTVPELSTTLLGKSYSRPWGVSPVGMTGLFWPGAEVTLAQHCVAQGLPFGLSTVAAASVEDLAPHVGQQGWFQLYPPREAEHCEDLLKRAKAAGFHTLVLTVDVPGPSRRERQRRGGLQTPPRITPRLVLQSALRPHWALAVARAGVPTVRGLAKYASKHEPSRHIGLAPHAAPDPELFKRLREMWDGPIIAKGVLVPAEAAMLRDLGFDAVWVSNHGGRQFDGAPGSAAALPLVRQAVGPEFPVLFDGAVDSGLDVLRAIALGADFVMLGRPWLWGVVSFGARGAEHVTHILTEDMSSGMIQMGITRPEEVRGRLWDNLIR